MKRAFEIAHLKPRVLLAGMIGRMRDRHVGGQARARAELVVELIAQDRREPRLHVRARLELVDIGQGAQNRLLHKVIGHRTIAREHPGECAHVRQMFDDRILKGHVPSSGSLKFDDPNVASECGVCAAKTAISYGSGAGFPEKTAMSQKCYDDLPSARVAA